MKISSFFKLVEIRTKLASVIPFIIGTLYAIYHFHNFNLKNFIILFISLFSFDMLTTTLNNYFDYKKANKKSGYNFELHNAIVRDNLSEKSVFIVIFGLFFIAVFSGIMLYLNTNIIILITGIICFAVGILYSFGPVPISRTPLGEVLSGIFMGFIIMFISIYIHIYKVNLISIALMNNILTLNINFIEVIYIILLSIPAVCCIANIMLANNICDMDVDLEDNRYTLPNYIGKKYSLIVFGGLYAIAFIDIIIVSISGVVSLFYLISLLTIIPVYKNIMIFYKNPSKKDTFSLSVKNFFLISGSQIIILGIIILLNFFLNTKL